MTSWIEGFVEHTINLESAVIYRKWAAITMIAAALEQKVWLDTGSVLYPNIYTFLVGHPGIGKSRAITSAANIVRDALPDVHWGGTSMTRAALSDYMKEAKRFIANIPYAPIEYNSLVIVADELSAFMHEYDSGLVAALVEFYDVNPYSEGRRMNNLRIEIVRPQLNILSGSTPSNLIHTLKDYVWDQGLMSRVMMIYADDRPFIDVFNTPRPPKPVELIYDLKLIWTLEGQFDYTDRFAKAMNDWKIMKMTPEPTHPKLKHYNTRRFAHLLKLSMIACVDRSMDLKIDVEDFNRAMGWLLEAESRMPAIFQTGAIAPDSRIMDEIVYFVKQHPRGVSEHLVMQFACQRASANTVRSILGVIEASQLVKVAHIDSKTGLRLFMAP